MTQETRRQKFKREVVTLLNRGPMNIKDIYEAIQKKYPNDCDGREPCEHNGHFYQFGEWKHIVRDPLQGWKKVKKVIYDSEKDNWKKV
ncbi:MAG: hypothetical protein Kow00103_15250 [Candidatus Caldatribacteriota bacterium]